MWAAAQLANRALYSDVPAESPPHAAAGDRTTTRPLRNGGDEEGRRCLRRSISRRVSRLGSTLPRGYPSRVASAWRPSGSAAAALAGLGTVGLDPRRLPVGVGSGDAVSEPPLMMDPPPRAPPFLSPSPTACFLFMDAPRPAANMAILGRRHT